MFRPLVEVMTDDDHFGLTMMTELLHRIRQKHSFGFLIKLSVLSL